MAIPNEPVTRQEQYLAAIADASGTLPDEPITRKEFYLAKAAGQDVETPPPITREEMYLDAIAEGGGGGGGEAVLIDNKSITENGEYLASSDSADGYKKVTVNVPTRELTLLAGGTYTKADDSSPMTIPVSFTGTPCQFVVVPDPPLSGFNQTCAWIGAWNLPKGGFWIANSCAKKLTRQANGTYDNASITAVTVPTTTLTLGQHSGNYPIKANTYKWEIWGYAE